MVDPVLDLGAVATDLIAGLEAATRHLNEMGLQGVKLNKTQLSLNKTTGDYVLKLRGVDKVGRLVSATIGETEGKLNVLNRTITENANAFSSQSTNLNKLIKSLRTLNFELDKQREKTISTDIAFDKKKITDYQKAIQQLNVQRNASDDAYAKALKDRDAQILASVRREENARKILEKQLDRNRDKLRRTAQAEISDTEKKISAIKREIQALNQLQQASIVRKSLNPSGSFQQTTNVSVREAFNTAKALSELTKFVEKNNVSAEQVRRVWQNVNSGIFKDYGNNLNNVQTLVQRFVKSQKEMGTAAERASKSIAKETAQIRQLQEASKVRNLFGGGFTGGGKTRISDAFNANQALTNLTTFVEKNQVSAAQVKQVWDNVSKGVYRDYGGSLNRVQTLVQRLGTSVSKLGDTNTASIYRSSNAFHRLNEQLEAGRKSSNELLLSWRSIFRVGLVQIGHRALSAFLATLHEANQQARELSIRIGEIQTIDNAGVPFNKWADELTELSNSFGIDVVDQAAGAYEILSNQLFEGVEATELLNTANKLAVTGVATTQEAVNLLSSAIIAFGKSTDEADRLAAGFFQTVDLGRTRINELANIYGRLAVPANQLGLSFEEVNAAIAVTTRQGVRTGEAFTFLRNIVLKLIKPTEEMSAFFAELGVSSGEAAIATYGLGGFLARLEERTQGSSTEIAELFSTIRAVTGAMVFAGDGIEQFNNDLRQMQQETVDLDEKLKLVQDTIGKRFDIELTKLKNSLRGLGTIFTEISIVSLKAVNAVISGFSEAEEAAKKFVEENNKNLDKLFKQRQDQLAKQEEAQREEQRKTLQVIAEQNAALNKQIGTIEDLEDAQKELEKVQKNLNDLRDEQIRKSRSETFKSALDNLDILPRFKGSRKSTEEKKAILIAEEAARIRQKSLQLDLRDADQQRLFIKYREDLLDLAKDYNEEQEKIFQKKVDEGKISDNKYTKERERIKRIKLENSIRNETNRLIERSLNLSSEELDVTLDQINVLEEQKKQKIELEKRQDILKNQQDVYKDIQSRINTIVKEIGKELDKQKQTNLLVSNLAVAGGQGTAAPGILAKSQERLQPLTNLQNILKRLATSPDEVTREEVVKAAAPIAGRNLDNNVLSTNLSELLKLLKENNLFDLSTTLKNSIQPIQLDQLNTNTSQLSSFVNQNTNILNTNNRILEINNLKTDSLTVTLSDLNKKLNDFSAKAILQATSIPSPSNVPTNGADNSINIDNLTIQSSATNLDTLIKELETRSRQGRTRILTGTQGGGGF